jgi:hypothetical protein
MATALRAEAPRGAAVRARFFASVGHRPWYPGVW